MAISNAKWLLRTFLVGLFACFETKQSHPLDRTAQQSMSLRSHRQVIDTPQASSSCTHAVVQKVCQSFRSPLYVTVVSKECPDKQLLNPLPSQKKIWVWLEISSGAASAMLMSSPISTCNRKGLETSGARHQQVSVSAVANHQRSYQMSLKETGPEAVLASPTDSRGGMSARVRSSSGPRSNWMTSPFRHTHRKKLVRALSRDFGISEASQKTLKK